MNPVSPLTGVRARRAARDAFRSLKKNRAPPRQKNVDYVERGS